MLPAKSKIHWQLLKFFDRIIIFKKIHNMEDAKEFFFA